MTITSELKAADESLDARIRLLEREIRELRRVRPFAGLPGPAGADGPTGPTGADGPTGPTGLGGAPGVFGAEHGPVATWNFNNDLVDSSGNGLTLTAIAGSASWSPLWADRPFLYVGPGLRLQRTNEALLRIVGDLTIQAIVILETYPSTAANTTLIARYEGAAGSELEADNILYSFGFLGGSADTLPQLQSISENAGGVNSSHVSVLGTPLTKRLMYVAMRRSSGQVQFFLNGRPLGPVSAGLVNPTGGTNASGGFTVGAQLLSTAAQYFWLGGLKVCASALSDADIIAEYNRTVGQTLGLI